MLCPGITEKAIKSLSARNKRDPENNKQDLVKRIRGSHHEPAFSSL
jgi:hypothetical protein